MPSLAATTDRAITPIQAAYVHMVAGAPPGLFFTGTVDSNRIVKKRIGTGLYDVPCGKPHAERLEKYFRYWVNRANVDLLGNNWQRRDPGIQFMLAWELQKRGMLHCHAYLAHPSIDLRDGQFSMLRSSWRTRWYDDIGIAQLELSRNVADCAAYCAKYCSKDRNGDVDFSRSWEALSVGQVGLYGP